MLTTAILANSLQLIHTSHTAGSAITATAQLRLSFLFNIFLQPFQMRMVP